MAGATTGTTNPLLHVSTSSTDTTTGHSRQIVTAEVITQVEPHDLRDGLLVGQAEFDVSVQPSCTCQSRVQHIGVIAGTYDNHTISPNRTIERNQQRVHNLKVIPSVLRISCIATVPKAIDFVQEQDARRAIPCLREYFFHFG